MIENIPRCAKAISTRSHMRVDNISLPPFTHLDFDIIVRERFRFVLLPPM